MSMCITNALRGRCLGAGLLALALALGGCATGPTANPRDPMEPWNRGVYKFNDALDKALVKPVATAYTTVTPTFMQKGVRNFFNNLGDAWSTVNSLLQFKGQEAMNTFWRFTINSTFGLGGMFDVAGEARIPQVKQDFGLTLGTWGIPAGPYMVLPILGPSSVRDTVALPVDMKGNPLGAITHVSVRNSLTGLGVINQRAQLMDTTDLLNQAALDPYAFMRDAYLQQRQARLRRTSAAVLGASAVGEGYEPPPDAVAPSGSVNEEGYEPPPEDSALAAAPAPEPAASSAAVAPPATPASGAPHVSGQTPYYAPAVPQVLDRLGPGWGGNFWKP